jgi:hypothetical protein
MLGTPSLRYDCTTHCVPMQAQSREREMAGWVHGDGSGTPLTRSFGRQEDDDQ